MSRLALALVLVGAIVGVAIGIARAPKNLALHKPVTMSSVRLGDPAAVVNGLIEWGSYGAHTWSDVPAWLMIDLEGTFPLDEVRVYNRGDGYYFDSSEPISVKVSRDGITFRRVAYCAEIFTQVTPCRAKLRGASARYVRIEHPHHLVLSEVEVIGRP